MTRHKGFYSPDPSRHTRFSIATAGAPNSNTAVRASRSRGDCSPRLASRRGSLLRVSELLRCDSNINAPIVLTTLFRGIVGHRVLRTITFARQSCGIDAA